MKNAQSIIFLMLAFFLGSCGLREKASSEGEVSSSVQIEAERSTAVASQTNPRLSNVDLSQATTDLSSVGNGQGVTASSAASYNREAQNAARQSNFLRAHNNSSSASLSVPSGQVGRDNPFALAEQPDFDVRFVAAKAPKSLPPIPNVGLGPESGSSLVPAAAPIAAPIELRPAVPTVVVPQEQADIAIAPNAPLVLPSPDALPPTMSPVAIQPRNISPTALAEAVEIKGVVQLGDQIAVIVNEGEGTLSRTVQPGARLAGGQVEFRRIDTTTAEPQVVLVQNGVEVFRSVGI